MDQPAELVAVQKYLRQGIGEIASGGDQSRRCRSSLPGRSTCAAEGPGVARLGAPLIQPNPRPTQRNIHAELADETGWRFRCVDERNRFHWLVPAFPGGLSRTHGLRSDGPGHRFEHQRIPPDVSIDPGFDPEWNFGFVLDGYPAIQSQAEFFLECYDLDGVILLDVADGILTDRLSRFRICETCGFDPNLIYAQPPADAVCEICGSALASRSSESPGAIEERLREFHTQTEPVIELLRQRELVVKVDGTKPTSEIHDFVRAALGLTSEAMAQRLRSSMTAK